MKSGKLFIIAMIPALSTILVTFFLIISSCASSLTSDGGGGGGGGGGGSGGLVDGTNYVNTTNVDLTVYIPTNTNVTTNSISNGYTVLMEYLGLFTNELSNWMLVLSANLSVTDTNLFLSNSVFESSTYTVLLVFTFLTNAFDSTNVWPPLMISNVTTNSNSITGGFEVFVTNYGYITNAVTNWLAYYTNDVLVNIAPTNQYAYEAVSNTYLRYTNGFVTNAFDTTNTGTDIWISNVTTNSNSISVGFEVHVTNEGYVTNTVTNWLEEVINGSVTATWPTNTYTFLSTSNVVAVFTNTFITNMYDTTNVGTDIWVSNSVTNSNSVIQGYEVFATNYGYLTNTVTNWLAAYTNSVFVNTWGTNSYIFLTATNTEGIIYTNYVTNQIDTTNFYGAVVGTNNTTNAGFVGKFWYTNIHVIGYFSNVITNWLASYTDSVTIVSNYSNHTYEVLPTNYVTSNSNFGIHAGIEMTNDASTVAIWSFNTGSGQTVADGSANGRNLTLGSTAAAETNDPSWTNWYSGEGYGTGSYSNSLFFNGASGQYAFWSGNFNLGSAIDISFWMKTTNATGIVISGGLSNFQIHMAAGRLWFTLGDFATNYMTSVVLDTITNGKWHYISCLYPLTGLNRIRIFVDGVQAAQTVGLTLITINNVTNVYVGGRPDFGTFFTGQLDNVRIRTTVDAAVLPTYFAAATNAN